MAQLPFRCNIEQVAYWQDQPTPLLTNFPMSMEIFAEEEGCLVYLNDFYEKNPSEMMMNLLLKVSFVKNNSIDRSAHYLFAFQMTSFYSF